MIRYNYAVKSNQVFLFYCRGYFIFQLSESACLADYLSLVPSQWFCPQSHPHCLFDTHVERRSYLENTYVPRYLSITVSMAIMQVERLSLWIFKPSVNIRLISYMIAFGVLLFRFHSIIDFISWARHQVYLLPINGQ